MNRFVNTWSARLVAIVLILTALGSVQSMQAQNKCDLDLSTAMANNGQKGVAFEVTALQSTFICRFSSILYTGNYTYEIWYNPAGLKDANGNAITSGWILAGTTTFSATTTTSYTEIPIDVNLLMDPGDSYGFIIWNVSNTLRYRTGTAPFVFSDSYISIDTQGWGVTGTSPNFSYSFYPRQFCGEVIYEEGCFFPSGAISYEIRDNSGQQTGFVETPGSFNLFYDVRFPDEQTDVTMTVNLWSVTNGTLDFSYTFMRTKTAGQNLVGMENILLPSSLASGYYRTEVIFNSKNSCLKYDDFIAPETPLLVVPRGTPICEVWPGDVNNNSIVNYGDRRDLNKYIFDANLRSSWLNGPARYDPEGGMSFLEWRPQAGAPWQTPEGCYMDADGNGVINNFDYIAIKLNWLRTHGVNPDKAGSPATLASFGMSQNYPNPFNPTTSIEYSAPERSQITLEVRDMLGRHVATLVDDVIDAGVHTAEFDASHLASGTYIATVSMTGIESGLSFRNSMKMHLSK